jgi:hypothetical protein
MQGNQPALIKANQHTRRAITWKVCSHFPQALPHWAAQRHANRPTPLCPQKVGSNSTTLGFVHYPSANREPAHCRRHCGKIRVRLSVDFSQEPFRRVLVYHKRCMAYYCVPPNFFHHIFLVRSSRTCSTIGAKIPRQCTIENCVSLQRRTHFRPQTFHRYLTTYGSGQHTRKCTPNSKIQR